MYRTCHARCCVGGAESRRTCSLNASLYDLNLFFSRLMRPRCRVLADRERPTFNFTDYRPPVPPSVNFELACDLCIELIDCSNWTRFCFSTIGHQHSAPQPEDAGKVHSHVQCFELCVLMHVLHFILSVPSICLFKIDPKNHPRMFSLFCHGARDRYFEVICKRIYDSLVSRFQRLFSCCL